MITKEQKEHILNLVKEIVYAERDDVWEQSRWDSSARAQKACQEDIDKSQQDLEQYLESIMA
ncbi:hypothetical protein ACQ46_gp120 [Citrobacter phage Moon]|uniref:Uncharacterized protein n=1 Tax=Citrobacter phage Moon TaxID=1540095 RepID=A0A0A0YQ64_9CAUD|nr:hypothetical protein ACQ46_gp120 [Citrobacter phage Moon]YP_010843992.1 hypothetical protein PP427_gp136 [Salmonella phage KM16]AIX12091.1 hypothetical protein CPT_Moon120 [Citrobacter phage Moon]